MDHALQEKSMDSSLSDSSSRISLQTSISTSSSSSSRPTSHHRRRSSVSTRRESAEMMGVVLPPSETSGPEDADTDSIRRHALLTLEGRISDSTFPISRNIGDFTKVEIPELDSQTFRFDTRNDSARATFQIAGNVNSVKRDSFGRALTPSVGSKEQQLHPLVEVDEDEENECQSHFVEESDEAIRSPPRHVVESPTSLASIPAARPGLKRLTLSVSPTLSSSYAATRSTVGAAPEAARRKSSLSYKRASDTPSLSGIQSLAILPNALPTPELTPVSAEAPLLSPNEQAFLHNNHSSLLARISELERVLLVRSRSMSIAATSSRQLSISSVSSDAASDEMLCLVRDLKSERDDLTRDVQVWESRVDDLEKQVNLLTRRVENERREAYQAKEKSSALEVEKRHLQEELNNSQAECNALRAALHTARSAETECSHQLRMEESKRISAERQLASHIEKCPATQNSQDNQRCLPIIGRLSTVKHKQDEYPVSTESRGLFSFREFPSDDSEDPLVHYEDEAEDDVLTYSDDSLSDQIGYAMPARAITATPNVLLNGICLESSVSAAPAPSVVFSTPPPTPDPNPLYSGHKRNPSLEQAWSFPCGIQPKVKPIQEVDRFFECLDDIDDLPGSLRTTEIPTSFQGVNDRYGFFSSVSCENEAGSGDDNDMPPFVIPDQRPQTPPICYVATELHSSTLTMELPEQKQGGSAIKELAKPREVTDRFERFHKDPVVALSNGTKKLSPSAIPKLVNANHSPSRLVSTLATPTSIPRMRAPSSIKPSNISNRPPVKSSNRTTFAYEESSVQDQSPSMNIKQAKVAKQPTAISSLSNYLPWADWSSLERHTVEEGSLSTTKVPQKLSVLDERKKVNTKLIPRTTKESAGRQTRPGVLSLL